MRMMVERMLGCRQHNYSPHDPQEYEEQRTETEKRDQESVIRPVLPRQLSPVARLPVEFLLTEKLQLLLSRRFSRC